MKIVFLCRILYIGGAISDMNLETICIKTIDAVRTAGAYILENYKYKDKHQVEEKGTHNLVTEIDKAAERILVNELSAILPEAGFITEEGTEERKGNKYNWIIDPIDGTTNYIHGAFPFAVSVALAEKDAPVIGVILELGRNECFYSWKEGGAYMDGTQIQVSTAKTMHESLIATGFPYTNYSKIDAFMKSIEWLIRNTRGMRRLGSAASDIAWVACGRYDGFYEYGLSSWDIAAGVLILQEAGGKSFNFSGEEADLFGGEIICTNGSNHEEFIAFIKSFLG
ncbi:inositol monophosphatase family protein [Bacteroidota bacterium]